MTPEFLYEVTTDDVTVWVNDEEKCIGRFGKMGIDIHQRTLSAALTEGECLFCTHEPPTTKDWDIFVEKMLELHGVRVEKQFKPKRFR